MNWNILVAGWCFGIAFCQIIDAAIDKGKLSFGGLVSFGLGLLNLAFGLAR